MLHGFANELKRAMPAAGEAKIVNFEAFSELQTKAVALVDQGMDISLDDRKKIKSIETSQGACSARTDFFIGDGMLKKVTGLPFSMCKQISNHCRGVKITSALLAWPTSTQSVNSDGSLRRLKAPFISRPWLRLLCLDCTRRFVPRGGQLQCAGLRACRLL